MIEATNKFDKILEKDVNKLEFEEAVGDLEAIVQALGEGSLSLKQATALYAKGLQLKTHCSKILEDVELKLNQISPNGIETANIEL